MKHRPARSTWRFATYLRPVRGLLALGLSTSLVQAVLQWIAPWPLKVVFDSVLASHPLPVMFAWLPAAPGSRLILLTGFTIAVALAVAATDYLANRWVAEAGQQVVAAIRADLFSHMQRQSLAFHQQRRTGDLMSRLDGDTQDIQSLTVDVLPTLVNNVITLAGFCVIMLAVNWLLGLVSLVAVPVLYGLVRHYLRQIKVAQRSALAAQGESAGVAQEVLSALPVVQANGAEERESARFGEANGRALRSGLLAVIHQSAFTPLVALTMSVTTALIVYVGARSVLAGHLTPGDVLLFSAYLRGMYTPVRQLAKLAGSAGRGQAAAERVAEILDTDEAIPVAPRPRRLVRAAGAITLDSVSLSYPDRDGALEGVSLEFAAGRRHAIVGRTGSGKSTILRLIPRLVDPDRGAVRLDGVDIKSIGLADLRRQISLVPQEPYLFRSTVWENICYGLPAASRPAAIQAAKAAGVHQVIESLPDGYDTVVAERGGSLSGGQRQCIALARAVARPAPILLFDEPTTGLDVEIVSILLAALDRVCEGRTAIVVSHELPAVRDADSIAVLDRGRLVERGTHQQLSRSGQIYAQFDALARSRPLPLEAIRS